MLDEIIRRAGGDDFIAALYRKADITTAITARRVGHNRDDHALTVTILAAEADPKLGTFSPDVLSRICAIYGLLQQEGESITRTRAEIAPIRLQPEDDSATAMLQDKATEEMAAVKERTRSLIDRQIKDKQVANDPATRKQDKEALDRLPYIEMLMDIVDRCHAEMMKKDPSAMPDLMVQVFDAWKTVEARTKGMMNRLRSAPLNTMKNHTLAFIRMEIWFDTIWAEREPSERCSH